MNNSREHISEGGKGAGEEWAALEKTEFSGGKSERLENKAPEKVAKEKRPTETQPTATEVLKETMKDPEWKKPEVKVFLAGKGEDKIDRETMLVYPISADKRAAVPREKATWSFMNQVHEAKTVEDFRAANLLAQTIEADKNTDPEVLEQIKEFKQSPAYLMKKAGFQVETTEQNLERDRETLSMAEQQYNEAKSVGFFKRLLNRREIKEKKDRMEWTAKRVSDGEAQLLKDREALAQFMPEEKAA